MRSGRPQINQEWQPLPIQKIYSCSSFMKLMAVFVPKVRCRAPARARGGMRLCAGQGPGSRNAGHLGRCSGPKKLHIQGNQGGSTWLRCSLTNSSQLPISRVLSPPFTDRCKIVDVRICSQMRGRATRRRTKRTRKPFWPESFGGSLSLGVSILSVAWSAPN